MKGVVIGAHLLRDDIEPLARAIPVGDLFLSAFDVAEDRPLGDRELVLEIAAVREHLLEVATFIAIRYGFTARSDEEAAGKCFAQVHRWRTLLTRHRGHVEITIKVAAEAAQSRPARSEFSNGAEYLRALHQARKSASVNPRFREQAERLIVPLTTDHRWMNRDQSSMEMVALIERERLGDVSAAGEELRRSCPGVPFLLSGPWPLEVFANDDLE